MPFRKLLFLSFITCLSLMISTLINLIAAPSALALTIPIKDNQTVQAITDTVNLPDVKLSAGYAQDVVANSAVTYSHILSNTSNHTDTVMLTATSSQNWLMALTGSSPLSGTLQGGTLQGSTLLGSLQLPLQIGAGLTKTIRLKLFVPPNTAAGTIDQSIITVTSHTSPSLMAVATNTTTITPTVYQQFMPIAFKSGKPTIKFGADFSFVLTNTKGITQNIPAVKEMGVDWVRYWVAWLDVEVAEGEYDWDKTDEMIIGLHNEGAKVLLVFHGAPSWSADNACGPMYDKAPFRAFLEAFIARYGPYVDAWEYTNEPEGDGTFTAWGSIIGCWAYHPQEYAESLGIFYSHVKRFDPGTPVLFGGLAYDNWQINSRTFFDETLAHGAGRYFDIANVHFYPINSADFPTSADKINELKATMAKHNVQGKEFWVTETSMWVNRTGSLEAQKQYIIKAYSRAFCNAGADNLFWFAVREEPAGREAFLTRWLIDVNLQPDNGYITFQHLAAKVKGTVCLGAYANVPATVEAYQFSSPINNRNVYILWTNVLFPDPPLVQIPLGGGTAILSSRDGEIVPFSLENDTAQFQITDIPLFLEVFEEGTISTEDSLNRP